MRKLISLAVIACAISAGGMLNAEESVAGLDWRDFPPIPMMALRPCVTPPVIDGVFTPEEWQDANAVSSLQRHGDSYYHPPTIMYLTYDDEYLYFAVRGIKERPQWYGAKSRFRDSSVYMDTDIELFLSPDDSHGQTIVYQYCFNPYGAIYDIRNMPDIGLTEVGYNAAIELESVQTQREWHLEARIPVKDIAEGFNAGDEWRFNIARSWPQRSWSLRGGFFIVRQNMGELRLLNDAPVIQWLDMYQLIEGSIDVEVAVKNLNDAPRTYILRAAATGENAGDLLARTEQRVTLAAGERKTVNLKADETFRGKRGHLELTCVSEDGNTAYYHQYVRFKGEETGAAQNSLEAFKQDVPPSREISVAARYGQTLNALEVQVDVWFLRLSGAQPERIQLAVYPEDDPEKIMAQHELTYFQKDLAIARFDMPEDLPFGEYTLHAVALDGAGRKISEAKGSFTRLDLASPEVNKPRRAREGRILDWIGNTIGLEPNVLPPWKPLQISGRNMSVWGREFSIGENALPSGITSQRQQLLAGPVQLVMRSGERTVPLQAGDHSGIEPNVQYSEAAWQSTLAAQGLRGTLRGKLEYDGLIKYELNLAADEPVSMDELYLDIPLRPDVAQRYLLPTGLSNLAPEQGVIWESKHVRDDEVMGTLIPYIWVGNNQFGLTWSADNTRGWYEQPGESVIELIRSGENVHLRVYFVRGPAEVNEVSAAFAILPTPAKPNPDGWRNLGLTPEWNYFWFDGWYGIEERVNNQSHLAWDDPWEGALTEGVRTATSRNSRVLTLPYTNPQFTAQHAMPWVIRDVSPVVPLLGEEWANMPSRWGPVKPVAGYRDWMADILAYWIQLHGYAGYYVDEPYGADGPDINLLNGSGWFDRHGNLRGSYHAMDTREMMKRMYAITHRYSRDGRPFVHIHASSFGLSPLWATWATAVCFGEGDWEIHIAPQSLVDRIPLDNLQFYNGKALGYISANFGERVRGERDAVLASRRSTHGDMLLHDMVPNFWEHYRDADHVKRVKLSFDIGANDVQFLGYWEDGCPVASSNETIAVSVYRRPERSLLVAVNLDRKQAAETELHIPPEQLYRIPGRWRVVNAETNEPIPVANDRVKISLLARDVLYMFVESTD